MRKYNEGYVLPLVMVVLIVLCVVSLSAMAPALNNLNAQQASLIRTQDRYEIIADANKIIAEFPSILAISNTIEDTSNFSGAQLLASFKEIIYKSVYENGDQVLQPIPKILLSKGCTIGDTPFDSDEYLNYNNPGDIECTDYFKAVAAYPVESTYCDGIVTITADLCIDISIELASLPNTDSVLAQDGDQSQQTVPAPNWKCTYTIYVKPGTVNGSYTISTKEGP